MRHCKLERTDQPGVLFCPRCKTACPSDDPPERTHRACCRKGLGTVIKKVTRALGIRSCRGCEKRADWLDRHVRLP